MAKPKSKQNIFVWILMGLLVLGLAGFGVDGFLGGQVRSIGQVGGRDIGAQNYARALQNEIRAIEQQAGQALPFNQVQAMGIDSQVRAQLVTQAALEAEAERIGISVGDETVQQSLMEISAFRGPGGEFDRETYRFALQNIGMTPSEFEAELRHDAARAILQAATAGGTTTPGNLRDALIGHFATRNDLAVFTLDESALEAPVAVPSQSAVEAYYEDNIERFTAPEIRSITYAWITPSMLLDEIEIDEEALRALYESRRSEYVQPERRLVERLVYPDEAMARAAMAEIEAGASFEDLVAARELDIEDTDMGDVSEAELGAAGPAVFALTEPGAVTGPHASPVGPAIFRMNAVLSAQETTFEEALPELRSELAGDSARRAIADEFDLFEDLLAGGATLEDLAGETALELGRIDWERGASEGIAAYEEFREAAAAASEGDFPEMLTLENGGVFALRLDGITAPAPRPLDTVQSEAREGARQHAVEAALEERAGQLAPALASDGVDAFAQAQGLNAERFDQVTRTDRLPGLPDTLRERLFSADTGAPVVLAREGRVYLGVVTDRQPADPDDAQTGQLIAAVDQQIASALSQDIFGYFARALEREAGISLNQQAIEAVHANFR
ncbi:MAG: SurA N-terminal domain-containing protein [Pararhodobacter sp.]|nr:SurA N-terminal domain-containing protein [Pararhodobacter sp.]